MIPSLRIAICNSSSPADPDIKSGHIKIDRVDKDSPFVISFRFNDDHQEFAKLICTPKHDNALDVTYDNWTMILELELDKGTSAFTIDHPDIGIGLPLHRLGSADFRFTTDDTRYYIFTDVDSVLDSPGYILKDATVFRNTTYNGDPNKTEVYLTAKAIKVGYLYRTDEKLTAGQYSIPLIQTLTPRKRLDLYWADKAPVATDLLSTYSIQFKEPGRRNQLLYKKFGRFVYLESADGQIALTLQKNVKGDLLNDMEYVLRNSHLSFVREELSFEFYKLMATTSAYYPQDHIYIRKIFEFKELMDSIIESYRKISLL